MYLLVLKVEGVKTLYVLEKMFWLQWHRDRFLCFLFFHHRFPLPSVRRFLGRGFGLASTAADVKRDTTASRWWQMTSVCLFSDLYSTWANAEQFFNSNKTIKCSDDASNLILVLLCDSALVKQWTMVPVVPRAVTLWFLCVCPAGQAVSSVRMAPRVGFRRTGIWEQGC